MNGRSFNMNWTGVIVTMVIGFTVGWMWPFEYLNYSWLGVIAMFIFGMLMSAYWPDEWDVFQSHPKDDDNDSIY
jgi:hypothetical protein